MAYAARTEVSADRTRVELEKLLQRRGATQFVSGWGEAHAMVGFHWRERAIRIEVPLLARDDPSLTHGPSGRSRTKTQAANAYDQMVRQRWRATLLIVQAKIEAIESGASTVDMEFGMSYVMPDGDTVAQHVLPRIEDAYRTGGVPELLPAPRPAIEMGG